MIKSSTFTLLFLLLISAKVVQAQRWTTLRVEESVQPIVGRLSYLSTIKYPGFNASIELPRRTKTYFKSDTSTVRKVKQQMIVVGSRFTIIKHTIAIIS